MVSTEKHTFTNLGPKSLRYDVVPNQPKVHDDNIEAHDSLGVDLRVQVRQVRNANEEREEVHEQQQSIQAVPDVETTANCK